MRWIPMLIGLALLASACSSGDGSSAPDTIESSTSVVSPSTAATTSTSAPDAPTTSTDASTSTTDVTTSSTTSSSAPAVSTSSTTAVPGTGGLAITNTGVGPLRFGARPDTGVEFLTGVLGLPTNDSGWGSSFSGFGTCPGSEVRGVSFGPLTVLFGDPEREREFYGWTYDAFDSPDLFGLSTEFGIGLGATIAEVQAAYPDASIDAASDPFPMSATFHDLFATFDDDGRVMFLSGGLPCGE